MQYGFVLHPLFPYYRIFIKLVYLYGVNLPGYRGLPGYLWQQSICWLFIFLSGFSFCLGRFHGGRRVKRGLLLTACGLLITAVTALVMPQSQIGRAHV